MKPASLILEPVGRNTAPALTLAALSLPEEDRKTVLLVMPADHVIRDNDAFLAAVSVGASMAEQGYLATLWHCPHCTGNRIWLYQGRQGTSAFPYAGFCQ